MTRTLLKVQNSAYRFTEKRVITRFFVEKRRNNNLRSIVCQKILQSWIWKTYSESVYYLRNSENELIGIDKSKSAKIKIFISEQNIDTFTKINQVDGRVYPEDEFNENDKLLKGFYFREDEIIKTVNDLFLEDKKFKLTKIKNLD